MKRLAQVIFLMVFTTSCAAPGASLWGGIATPTPPGSATPTRITYALVATITPSPTATPPMVMPISDIPTPGALLIPTLPPINPAGPMLLLRSHSGDTLDIIAKRANVRVDQIISDVILPAPNALLDPGIQLLVPDQLPAERTSNGQMLPDSEFVLSPATIGFDTAQYVSQAGGYLAIYTEYLMSNGETSGAQAVEKIAYDNSINPRLLLAIIELESHWVRGTPTNFAQDDYPLGYVDYHYQHLYRQMMWAVGELSVGYYGWRSGEITQINFEDGSSISLSPSLNAATVGLMYFFSKTRNRETWAQAVAAFPGIYTEMFGDPWPLVQASEPLFPPGLTQPELSLPFEPGQLWAYTGGPHSAWERKGAMAAIDFAPGASETGCIKSDSWVVAPAPGLVVRTNEGVVILDLDGDGHEETGWVLLFLHIASQNKVKVGDILQKDDKIGHPSCEGGVSTGTHVHFARKYNGEWMLAGGVLPFTLSGWVVAQGSAIYKGALTRNGIVVNASTSGSYETRIIREKDQ
ncbi:MAG: M23 family metallopeptidase [Anaerolineales bacterium]|jgi:murein DD-endopeptidase MepM/ murein hydrolase activator NlpD|nr:M23 family metallopeptidase [Anaerolineales bacterium]